VKSASQVSFASSSRTKPLIHFRRGRLRDYSVGVKEKIAQQHFRKAFDIPRAVLITTDLILGVHYTDYVTIGEWCVRVYLEMHARKCKYTCWDRGSESQVRAEAFALSQNTRISEWVISTTKVEVLLF